MAAERWIFTRSQLENTPSRRCGIDSDKELNYRQHTANFIQEMGQKLQVYPSLNNKLLKIGVTSCVHSFSKSILDVWNVPLYYHKGVFLANQAVFLWI